jgi:dTDP-4-amino-4,6-dideoxygalactose transaminase
MTDWQVPLADLVITDADLAAVVDVYRSGWLSMGPRTEELEAAFAGYTGARHAIAVANGTAALHLVCQAVGLGPGDEVIVPSLTFVATANAVAYTGATPVFADVAGLSEPWLSCRACEAAITDRTRAVMTVDYGGHCGELEALRALCADRGLVLLEDAAHAAGSRLDGSHLGTFGLAGAFSLFSNKNFAIGEGGLVVTDDDAVADRVRLLRSHGMTSLTWDRHRGHASDYDVVGLGFNYRMDEPRAALATSRLGRLDAENRRRAELDARYRQALEGLDLAPALPAAPGLESAHHLFVAVLDEGVDRDAFRRRLADAGIQTSVHYPPLHQTTLYRDSGARLPVTEEYASRAVTLPLFAHLAEADQDRVIAAAQAALASGVRV